MELDAQVVGPPPLPTAPNGQPWPEVVQSWYSVWASSPQASQFLATDWQRLHMIAPLILEYYGSFDRAVFIEIRLNESLLGATVVDRQRLRMDLPAQQPTQGEANDVSWIDDARSRLRGAG